MRISVSDSRHELLVGLRARRAEIDWTVLARIQAIGDAGAGADAEYLDGLRRAAEAAVGHTLEAIGRPEDLPVAVPDALLGQARRAARSGVPLETMLRRYLAGHAVVVDFVAEEAGRREVPAALLGPILRSLSARTDLTVAAISSAYVEEQASGRPASAERRRVELIRRLLSGELMGSSQLRYDLDAWHLGLIATSAIDAEAIRGVVAGLDRAVLQVDMEAVSWAWLGGRRPFDAEELAEVEAYLGAVVSAPVALGEPACGLRGWRVTHRQAAAMIPIARRQERPVRRYGQDPLLASALHDELLANSLRELYLAPLRRERDGGAAARETLRAYFAAAGNVTSAASALRISRKTVNSRLAAVEERLGRPLASASAEIQTALRLDEMED